MSPATTTASTQTTLAPAAIAATLATALTTTVATTGVAATGAVTVDRAAHHVVYYTCAAATHAFAATSLEAGAVALHVRYAHAGLVVGGTLDDRPRRGLVHRVLCRNRSPGIETTNGRAANAASGAQQHRG